MSITRRISGVAGCFLLASVLAAQIPEPTTLGVQVRGAFPEAGLANAAGGGRGPGAGFSVVMEDDLVEHFEGWHARADVGMDFWFWGQLTKSAGSTGRVSVAHVSGELVRMLRPGATPVALGPYFIAGVGFYEWSWQRNDSVAGWVDVRNGKMAASLGFGWRQTTALDFEAKVLAGQMDPSTSALAVVFAATWRF